MTGKNVTSTTKSIGAIFDEADKNGDGRITTVELKKFFIKKGIHVWTPAEFKELWRDADSDRDNFITYDEFANVMERAKSSYAGHAKWQSLLHAMLNESGTPLEIQYEKKAYNRRSHVSTKPLVGNNTNTIKNHFSKWNFVAGREYFVTVNEAGSTNKEVAKSTPIKVRSLRFFFFLVVLFPLLFFFNFLLICFIRRRSCSWFFVFMKCIDTDAITKERQRQMLRRQQEALSNAKALRDHKMLAAKARAKAQREQDKMDRLAASLQNQSRDAMIARIQARKGAVTAAKQHVKTYVSHSASRVIDQAFDDIDTNGNGVISYAEFSNYVKKHGVSAKDVKNMFDVADSSYGNDDMQIQRSEFRTVMNLAGGYNASPAWNKLYERYSAGVSTKRGTVRGGGARPAKRARARR